MKTVGKIVWALGLGTQIVLFLASRRLLRRVAMTAAVSPAKAPPPAAVVPSAQQRSASGPKEPPSFDFGTPSEPVRGSR